MGRSTSPSTTSTPTTAHIAYIQLRLVPAARARHGPEPARVGHRALDWRGFDPDRRARLLPSGACRRTSTRRAAGFANWNNKQAPGWRAADDDFSYGSVHRSERLEDRVRAGAARTAASSTSRGLTRRWSDAATVDLRGQESLPAAAAGDRATDGDAELDAPLRPSTRGPPAAPTGATWTATASTTIRRRRADGRLVAAARGADLRACAGRRAGGAHRAT